MYLDNHRVFRWSAFLVVILAMGLGFAGCSHESDDIPTGPAETVDYIIHQGWDHYNNGQYDDAIQSFQTAANASASDLEAYLGLGYSFAQRTEMTRAQQNLGNVIALATVLLDDPESDLTQEYADSLMAEAYAGKAAAYLAAGDDQNAIASAALCLEIWDTFTTPEHRWIPGFTEDRVKLIEAEAHYGAGEYNEAMYIVDDLMNNQYISASSHILNASETLPVTLLQDTDDTGIASLVLQDHMNLIQPTSVAFSSGTAAEVVSFTAAGNTVLFKSIPKAQQGDTFDVDYLYADDYGQFLIELREKLQELQG